MSETPASRRTAATFVATPTPASASASAPRAAAVSDAAGRDFVPSASKLRRLAPLKLVNLPVAIGFGLFFAWQIAIVTMLYPPSQGLLFSPLVCQSFACCLVLVVALFGFAKNRASVPRDLVRAVAAVLVTVATLAAVLVINRIGGLAVAYPAALVIGCAVAILLYAWAEVLAGVNAVARLGTVLVGLCVSSLASIAVGHFSSGTLNIALAVLAAGSLAMLLAVSVRFVPAEPEPLTIRPARSNHFRLSLFSIVLYAFVFGSVSGSTAGNASEEFMCSFTLGMSQAMLLVSAVVALALMAWGRPVRLATVGRILTPILAVLLLLHIPLQGSANGWLPRLTLGFWELVQVFVLLLLIEVAEGGTASLSFTFPLGWAVVAFGFACGALFGQTTGLAFGTDPVAVQNIAVGLTIVAVVAASLHGSARYPKVDDELVVARDDSAPVGAPLAAGSQVSAASSGSAALTADPVDPIGAACADLVVRCALSDREREVIELLARGNTRASIAEKLCISENTVRVHVKNIYAKLHIHSKQQLIDMVDRHS